MIEFEAIYIAVFIEDASPLPDPTLFTWDTSEWSINTLWGFAKGWIELRSDVLSQPPPRWNTGIMGNSPLDKVGNPGRFSFTLNNSESNSAGLAGYYTPGHTNALSGWTTGLPVFLAFQADNIIRYKYYGKILPRGIQVVPGTKGPRRVMVTCGDFMEVAASHEFVLPTLAENKRIDEVVPLITDEMPIQPLATSFATGEDTFPTVFDTVRQRAKAITEFVKLTLSEFGFIYRRGDRTGGETLVVESRLTRSGVDNANLIISGADSGFLLKEDGDFLLQETGDKIILDEAVEASFDNVMHFRGMRVSYGKNLSNRIAVNIYPRRIDGAATTVLYSLEKSFKILAGETQTGFRGAYRDPEGISSKTNGKEMVVPVSGTDYVANDQEDGGGANRTADLTVDETYGTEAVSYDLTNTGGTDLWVTKLQARGKGIYWDDIFVSIFEDSDSQDIHGTHMLTLDMKYQEDAIIGQAFADYVLNAEKDPDFTVDAAPLMANRSSMNFYGFLDLEPGTKAEFIEDQANISGDWFIQGYSAQILAGKYVLWVPVLQAASKSSFWLWDTSKWDINTVWGDV
jgi:hypothetical protein